MRPSDLALTLTHLPLKASQKRAAQAPPYRTSSDLAITTTAFIGSTCQHHGHVTVEFGGICLMQTFKVNMIGQ